MEMIWLNYNIAGSSNGRTSAFGAEYEGPIPSPAVLLGKEKTDTLAAVIVLAGCRERLFFLKNTIYKLL